MQEPSMKNSLLLQKADNLDFYMPNVGEAVHEAHVSKSGSISRLTAVRNIVILAAKNKVVDYHAQKHPDSFDERFKIIIGPYTLSLMIQSYNSMFSGKRRVTSPSSALTNNKAMYLLQEDWMARRGIKEETELATVLDLILRTFTMCSESSRYAIEFDEGYWSWLYTDMRNNACVELIVES